MALTQQWNSAALPMVDAPMKKHVAADNAADDGRIEEMVAHDADDV